MTDDLEGAHERQDLEHGAWKPEAQYEQRDKENPEANGNYRGSDSETEIWAIGGKLLGNLPRDLPKVRIKPLIIS